MLPIVAWEIHYRIATYRTIDRLLTINMKNEEEKSKAKGYWEPPPRGWLKVNIDGSFV
jgi:hypothetical protein